MAGVGWGVSRHRCHPPHNQRPTLGRHRLRPMQRGRGLGYGRSDPALLRRRVQPSSAALRPWLARGSRRRDDCIGDWGEQLPTG